jgi:ribosomal protein L9
MLILFFILLFIVFGGLILTGQKIREMKKEHRKTVEHLHLTVVELAGKQLDLSDKVQSADVFKANSRQKMQKLNSAVFDLCDLLINTTGKHSIEEK